MQDARYLRAHAQLCLDMAQQMSRYADAEQLRAQAAVYLAKAEDLEGGNREERIYAPPRSED